MTASWFMVIVPVLSTQSTSIVAASSAALSRVTRTPRWASSLEPSAMLTVNITGSATGTALISRTSMSGTISTSGIAAEERQYGHSPEQHANDGEKPTHNLRHHGFDVQFRACLLHELGGAAEISLRAGQHNHAVAFSPADDGARREHVARRLFRFLGLSGESRLINAHKRR